jgi:shikimate dehydrogenase
MATIRALRPSGVDSARCALLGAGGSAAAVLVALHALGCREIALAARSVDRASRLVERLNLSVHITAHVADAVRDAELVINATPIGLQTDDFPVELRAIKPSAAIFDLVYRRDETPWVRAGRAHGHRAEDGLRMLLEQGAAAFACWFGEPVPRDAMWASLGRANSHV